MFNEFPLVLKNNFFGLAFGLTMYDILQVTVWRVYVTSTVMFRVLHPRMTERKDPR